MNIKTYLDKTNTIIYNSEVNTGQNPVCELYYGDGFTRILLHFNTDKIKSLIDDKTYVDTTKLKHILKFKNCWGLQEIGDKYVFGNTTKERTSSFDLYLIRMPETWDAGIGNEFSNDGFLTKRPNLSTNASNWFNSGTNTPWTTGSGAITGITSGNTVTIQHFDIGNEDIEMDITDEVNNIISGNTINNGYMLKFNDIIEETSMLTLQYVGLFAQPTNTFFVPFIQTTYSEIISDDRKDFYLDKDNKLYFYSRIGGSLQNLDQLPICFIDSTEYEVFQTSKGVYYIEVNLSGETNIMLYDTWTNIIYNGKTFPNIELDFVTKTDSYFNFGSGDEKCKTKKYIPNASGIKNNEKIVRSFTSDIRKIVVQCREEYSTNKNVNLDNITYSLYVKESNKILEVDNGLVEKSFSENYFYIDIESLLPNQYYLDIKINSNDEIIVHREKLIFEIVSEI